jgi:hypothetical protein
MAQGGSRLGHEVAAGRAEFMIEVPGPGYVFKMEQEALTLADATPGRFTKIISGGRDKLADRARARAARLP